MSITISVVIMETISVFQDIYIILQRRHRKNNLHQYFTLENYYMRLNQQMMILVDKKVWITGIFLNYIIIPCTPDH